MLKIAYIIENNHKSIIYLSSDKILYIFGDAHIFAHINLIKISKYNLKS